MLKKKQARVHELEDYLTQGKEVLAKKKKQVEVLKPEEKPAEAKSLPKKEDDKPKSSDSKVTQKSEEPPKDAKRAKSLTQEGSLAEI